MLGKIMDAVFTFLNLILKIELVIILLLVILWLASLPFGWIQIRMW